MLKAKNINFSKQIAENLVSEIVKKVPGINSNQSPIVSVNTETNTIDILFVPLSSIFNVYDVAKEIQDLV